MRPELVLPGLLILSLVPSGCSWRRSAVLPPSSPRQEIIAQIKDFQRDLGFQNTKNFLRYADNPRAFYRCYYTGKLELPVSYEQLRLSEGNEAGCSLDEEEYDVFFYPIEAVASGTSPLTTALKEATLERFLVVVLHEDFHNQKESKQSAPEITEAATTLIGFLTAAQFAKEKYGTDSRTFQDLDREAELFLQKAEIVNAFYDKLRDVYASFRSQTISRTEALVRKEHLFAELQAKCLGIKPEPVAFNKCPVVMNNASLTFERTYSHYYPRLFEYYTLRRGDTKATVAVIKRLLATSTSSESDLNTVLGIQRHPNPLH